MLAEAPFEHPQAVLLVGEVPDSLRDRLAPARAQGWRLHTADNVYGAAALLLRAVRLPAAVLVLPETLRGDELRFFDFLARRFPSVPVAAAACAGGQDRRLDVCRRKSIAVLDATAVADWLSQCWIAPESAQPVATPAAPQASQTQDAPEPVAVPPAVDLSDEPEPQVGDEPHSSESEQDEPRPQAIVAEPEPQDLSGPSDPLRVPIEQLPEESFVDLPDELVAHLPDDLDDDLPEEAPVSNEEQVEASLEDELPPLDEDEQYDEEQESADLEPESDLDDVPLTPWSDIPRPERKRPLRTPPRSNDVPPAAAEQPHVVPDQPARRQPDNMPPPDYGLLTPEELRALLQDPEEGNGQQGGQR